MLFFFFFLSHSLLLATTGTPFPASGKASESAALTAEIMSLFVWGVSEARGSTALLHPGPEHLSSPPCWPAAQPWAHSPAQGGNCCSAMPKALHTTRLTLFRSWWWLEAEQRGLEKNQRAPQLHITKPPSHAAICSWVARLSLVLNSNLYTRIHIYSVPVTSFFKRFQQNNWALDQLRDKTHLLLPPD